VHVIQPEDVVFDGAERPRADSDMKELARLADSLVEHLAETRRHYEQLRADLDSVGPLTTLETPSGFDADHGERVGDYGDEDPDRARLLALNLALSGWSRDDVSDELDDKFPFMDADEILDAVFPDTPADEKPKRRFIRRRARS
jgi:hypothetical protein